MNNRIAKKILVCASTLKDKRSVAKARQHYRENEKWFNDKGIFLLPYYHSAYDEALYKN